MRFYSEAPLPGGWGARLNQAGATIVPMGAIAQEETDAWLLDGYRFEPGLQTRLRRMGVLAVVDDHGTIGRYDADLIVDHNLGALESDYHLHRGDVQLLLGTKYALLRTEVVGVRPLEPPNRSERPKRLLVSVGGEPSQAVNELLQPVVQKVDAWGLEVIRLTGVVDVSEPLRAADLAISAAGGTCWDLCAFGLPSVVVAVAANQRPVARRLGDAGAALDAGDLETITPMKLAADVWSLLEDPDRRQRQAQVGHTLVDGGGARRVVTALRDRISL